MFTESVRIFGDNISALSAASVPICSGQYGGAMSRGALKEGIAKLFQQVLPTEETVGFDRRDALPLSQTKEF